MRKSIYRFLLINITIVAFILTFATYYILRIVDNDKVSQIADMRLDHIIDTVETRNNDFESLLDQIEADSISKAHAVSIIINQSPEIYKDMSGIEKLRAALGIEQIVVTDSEGIIKAASIPDIGTSIKDNDIYSQFMPAIAIKDYQKSIHIIQNNKLYQYAAVPRVDSKGVVIICENSKFFEDSVDIFGMTSIIEKESFLKYGNMAIINKDSWRYEANTDAALVGKTVQLYSEDFENNLIDGKGNFKSKYLGKKSIIYYKEYKNYYIMVQIGVNEVYGNSNYVITGILISLLIVSVTVILSVRSKFIKNSIE